MRAPFFAFDAALAAADSAQAQEPHATAREAGAQAEPAIVSTIIDASGAEIGEAQLYPGAGLGVLIRVSIGAGGLEPGWHGLQIHETGLSDDIRSFTLSGGQVGYPDPDDESGPFAGIQHGLLNPEGPEAGDMPNIWAHADGSAMYEAYNDRLALAGHAPSVIDDDSAAMIIHSGRDDQLSQPIGGAGPRVACAAFPNFDAFTGETD